MECMREKPMIKLLAHTPNNFSALSLFSVFCAVSVCVPPRSLSVFNRYVVHVSTCPKNVWNAMQTKIVYAPCNVFSSGMCVCGGFFNWIAPKLALSTFFPTFFFLFLLARFVLAFYSSFCLRFLFVLYHGSPLLYRSISMAVGAVCHWMVRISSCFT